PRRVVPGVLRSDRRRLELSRALHEGRGGCDDSGHRPGRPALSHGADGGGAAAPAQGCGTVIPLKDDVPSQSTPFVTYGLIGLNVIVYLYQFSLSLDTRGPGAGAFESFIGEFGAVPCRLTGACATADQFPHPIATIFSSMFMHGNLLHLLGNMLYLWIF